MIGKSKIFLLILLSFVFGIGVASFNIPFNAFIIFILFLSAVAILTIGFKNLKLRIVCFFVISFVVGMWRYSFSQPVINQNHIAFYNGQKVLFIGIVLKEPDTRVDQVKLTIEVERISLEEEREIKGRVLVSTTLYPEYYYGDKIKVFCQLERPEKIEDFAYDQYLASFNIYSVCYRPQIEILAKNQGVLILAKIYQIKNGFMDKINQILPEPEASFLGGLLLGAKKSMPADLREDFNRTGTTHIVAISGYNITIIAVLLLSFCKTIGISRKKSFWLILIALFFFVLITGAQSSVVRAAIMGILVLLAKQLGRISRITNALILAGVIMLLINPKVLRFDAGFQLSFLAAMGLAYLSPLLEKKFCWLPSKFQIKESFLATFSATVFTLPLILFQFQRFSFVALFVNILILPFIPWTMGLGFLSSILTFLWFPLGQFSAFLVWLFLTYIIRVVEIFSNLSFAAFNLPKMPWPILVFSYILLIFGIFRMSQKQNRSLNKGTVLS